MQVCAACCHLWLHNTAGSSAIFGPTAKHAQETCLRGLSRGGLVAALGALVVTLAAPPASLGDVD